MNTVPQKNSSRTRRATEAAAVFTLASVFAILGTMVIAYVADTRGWCCVHSWAFAHGTGAIVLLLCGLAGFHIVRTVGVRTRALRAASQFGWLAHTAYVGGALGTFLYTDDFVWLGLIAGMAAVVRRMRGQPVNAFGIAIVGFVVSLLAGAYWLYIESMFLFTPQNGG